MKKKIQKPFDIEAAKRGATVETRDGNPVRIVCYDRKSDYPIIALANYGPAESYSAYSIKGKYIHDCCSNEDLVIVEEVECPKFQEGDYIVSKLLYKILRVDNTKYATLNISSDRMDRWDIKNIDKHFHLWSLNDAKPGDILVCKNNNNPFIFKGCIDEAHPGCPVAYCGINCNGEFTSSTCQIWWTDSSVRPATYKERQQFFNKMKEEGYKWEAESFTLSKIQERWRDKDDAEVNGYYIHSDSHIIKHSGYNSIINNNIFATKKQAKAALAMARISQIMANDERFGGVVTDKEWSDNHWRYAIIRANNTLMVTTRDCYEYLGFNKREQAELFLKENEDLIRDYYMMD